MVCKNLGYEILDKMILKIKKVIIGVSGGVDSAVAALLLKTKGYNVEGVFMQNWDIADEQGECSASKDYKDASIVCDKLDIKLHHVNFVKHYWNHVFSNLLKEYETGHTPNPDILCNKYIKFDHFVTYAREHLHADAFATGHYAKTSFGPYLENYEPNEKVKLLCASSIQKDQTFFLSQVKQESLQRAMFPVGSLLKSTVKQIAFENKLTNVVTKKESMGICFIGSRNFKNFISEYIENKSGHFIDFDTIKVKGFHNGIHHWTIGQRSLIPSCIHSNYVARKEPCTNTIYVAEGWNHGALYTDLFLTSKPHWIHSEPTELKTGSVLSCDFKFQHVESVQKCWLFVTKQGLIVSTRKPIRAITAGQFAVFYKDNECLGSARIVHPGICRYFILNYRRKMNMPTKNINVKNSCTNNKIQDCNFDYRYKKQCVQ